MERSRSSLTLVCTFVLSSLGLLGLGGCTEDSAVNFEVYRAAAGQDQFELLSAGCIAREVGGGAGGGTNEYAMQQSDAPDGGIELSYLLPPSARSVEDPVELDDPDLVVAATLTLSMAELESGEVFELEFERADGARFEAVHWGSQGCD